MLQKVQLGDTVLSKAFSLLFSIMPLFLRRYRKFRISLCIQLEFHRPRHFFSGASRGGFVFARFEKVVTVLKLYGSAELFELSSSTSRNFFDPFFILVTKFSTVSQRLSVSSIFHSLFLATSRADWSRIQLAPVRGIPSARNSSAVLSRLPTKQS